MNISIESTTTDYNVDITTNSSDDLPQKSTDPFEEDENRALVLTAITYTGAAISIFGILLTLLSYIGYRKFHVKRTHIVMVNLCSCLLLYFIAYIVSNKHRRHNNIKENFEFGTYSSNTTNSICVATAFICHVAELGTWFWTMIYWIVLLIMHKKPMGGHVSHFFIKSAAPSYGITILISFTCFFVAFNRGDTITPDVYSNNHCFVTGYYLFLGLFLPCLLLFIAMLAMFVIILRGMWNKQGDSTKTARKKRLKSHLLKLTVLTVLILIMIVSSALLPELSGKASGTYVAYVIFAVVSTGLGSVLMILFCWNQEEIRKHWMAVARGESVSMRKTKMTGGRIYIDKGQRESSSVNYHVPSVYLDTAEISDQRKSSTIRIVAKQDTDMTTLNQIKIPGTPSPDRVIGDKDKHKKDINGNQGDGDELIVKTNNEHHRKSKIKTESFGKSSRSSKYLDSLKKQKSVDHVLLSNKPVNKGGSLVARLARKSLRSASSVEETVPIASDEITNQ